jgi:hypothetical protein
MNPSEIRLAAAGTASSRPKNHIGTSSASVGGNTSEKGMR